VLIGVNDVWRAFDGQPELAVESKEFETTLERLLLAAQANGANLMLLEPFMVETDDTNPMKLELTHYVAALERIAARLTVPLVRTQTAFDRLLLNMDATKLSDDRVHPTRLGHTLLALEVLKAAGVIL
jgi:acyl-CoA thioesterase I